MLHVDDALDVTVTFLDGHGDLVAEMATSADAAWSVRPRATSTASSATTMPGTGGLEFLPAVRDRRLEVLFILFTAPGNETVASDGISAGVSDYHQKEIGTDQ